MSWLSCVCGGRHPDNDWGDVETWGHQPLCGSCGRPVPEYVQPVSVIFPCTGLCFCGPCLWDDYTPLWREHSKHTEPYTSCRACEQVGEGKVR